MKHPWQVWVRFVLCLVVACAALVWISRTALRVEQAEAEARQGQTEAFERAAWEENVRLALWRMDSILSELVARESARPYFAYNAFVPVNRTVARMLNPRDGSESLVPSPLLTETSADVKLYFQFESGGSLTSPQVPQSGQRDRALRYVSDSQKLDQLAERLKQLDNSLDRLALLAKIPVKVPESVLVIPPLGQSLEEQYVANTGRMNDLKENGRGFVEFNQRNALVNTNSVSAVRQQITNNFGPLKTAETDLGGSLMKPFWVEQNLMLVRRVTVAGKLYVQGCLLDWKHIKASLEESVDDLLPDVDLQPAETVSAEGSDRMLAALPVRLVCEPPLSKIVPSGVLASQSGLSPIQISLALAWLCMVLAAAAVALLLWGVVRLSERRASFVTAVTHEMRSPLTTFQMYTEMLTENMVSDEQRQQYLETLQGESLRLTHLVENVLAYARLERTSSESRQESVSLGELLESVESRLALHAERGGFELVVDCDKEARETLLLLNRSAVEQILFNLVDNACKYAVVAELKRIELNAVCRDGAIMLSVRDYGPGVSAVVRRKLFSPFSKSAQQAAHSAPGIGLGLALSRRMARDLGGDLVLDDSVESGTRFVLRLPVE